MSSHGRLNLGGMSLDPKLAAEQLGTSGGATRAMNMDDLGFKHLASVLPGVKVKPRTQPTSSCSDQSYSIGSYVPSGEQSRNQPQYVGPSTTTNYPPHGQGGNSQVSSDSGRFDSQATAPVANGARSYPAHRAPRQREVEPFIPPPGTQPPSFASTTPTPAPSQYTDPVHPSTTSNSQWSQTASSQASWQGGGVQPQGSWQRQSDHMEATPTPPPHTYQSRGQMGTSQWSQSQGGQSDSEYPPPHPPYGVHHDVPYGHPAGGTAGSSSSRYVTSSRISMQQQQESGLRGSSSGYAEGTGSNTEALASHHNTHETPYAYSGYTHPTPIGLPSHQRRTSIQQGFAAGDVLPDGGPNASMLSRGGPPGAALEQPREFHSQQHSSHQWSEQSSQPLMGYKQYQRPVPVSGGEAQGPAVPMENSTSSRAALAAAAMTNSSRSLYRRKNQDGAGNTEGSVDDGAALSVSSQEHTAGGTEQTRPAAVTHTSVPNLPVPVPVPDTATTGPSSSSYPSLLVETPLPEHTKQKSAGKSAKKHRSGSSARAAETGVSGLWVDSVWGGMCVHWDHVSVFVVCYAQLLRTSSSGRLYSPARRSPARQSRSV